MNDIVPAPERRSSSRPPLLIALAVVLFLESALVVSLTVWLLIDLLTVTPQSFASAIAIFVLVAIAAAWVVGTSIAVLRGQSWSRASAVTIQILQIAIAVGSFQGIFARPDLGWALLVPAVVGVILALSPQVIRATTRNTTQHD
ncbi:hypothetical protein ACFVWR_03890 [Leifsonia sp. NPDC058292]|uniref:hypothetical protein n=1 Tax=Leifsonia sp. NPDC058292 TaxID=3346428 RepID=UPI0036DF1D9C